MTDFKAGFDGSTGEQLEFVAGGCNGGHHDGIRQNAPLGPSSPAMKGKR